jgi:hypothetical protein
MVGDFIEMAGGWARPKKRCKMHDKIAVFSISEATYARAVRRAISAIVGEE